MPRSRNTNSPRSRAYRPNENGESRLSRIVLLPADGCRLPVPSVPKQCRDVWSAEQKRRWRELWQSPQATQWDESCNGTVALLVTYETALLEGRGSAWMAQEARYASDALGLTPKAMNALGWRVVNDTDGDEQGERE
ncbi:phage terminase small subunit [Bifidobacterium moukalabense]|uniref:phage terminase small subunit n=1 Tax=Bifidobacterium moukalabense TaxID=1333651 RepID=UPI001BB25510|nr:hypothetical protein [Bifidobacterium moukalabense]